MAGDPEAGGGILNIAAGHVVHVGLHKEHLVVIALALIFAAGDDVGTLIAHVLSDIDAGTGQRAGAQQHDASQDDGKQPNGFFHEISSPLLLMICTRTGDSCKMIASFFMWQKAQYRGGSLC